ERMGLRVLALCLIGASGLLAPWGSGQARGQSPGQKEEISAEERARLMKQAKELTERGGKSFRSGRLAEATELMEQAVPVLETLYSPDRYPDGHPALAASLNNLSTLLRAMGQYGKALPYQERVLAMSQKLFPPERYPDGHPDLAGSLNNLGALWVELG